MPPAMLGLLDYSLFFKLLFANRCARPYRTIFYLRCCLLRPPHIQLNFEPPRESLAIRSDTGYHDGVSDGFCAAASYRRGAWLGRNNSWSHDAVYVTSTPGDLSMSPA